MDIIPYLKKQLDAEVEKVFALFDKSNPSEFEKIIENSEILDRFSAYFKIGGINRAYEYEIDAMRKFHSYCETKNMPLNIEAECWYKMFMSAHTKENTDNYGIDNYNGTFT